MKRTLVLLALSMSIVAAGALSGCSDAEQAKWQSNGQPNTIDVYSGGVLVRHFESTGRVQNEDHSDGYYFEDAATHKLTTVSGAVVVSVK